MASSSQPPRVALVAGDVVNQFYGILKKRLPLNLQRDALPAQPGQAGNFLTTDGTSARWRNIDAANVGAVPIVRTIAAGSNLVGGGDLSDDRTIALSPDVAVATVTATGEVVAGSLTSLGTITGNGSGITDLNASNLASGTVATARLGTGTAVGTTFLRGDQTWTEPLPAQTTNSGKFLTTDGTSANWTALSQGTGTQVAYRKGNGIGGMSGSSYDATTGLTILKTLSVTNGFGATGTTAFFSNQTALPTVSVAGTIGQTANLTEWASTNGGMVVASVSPTGGITGSFIGDGSGITGLTFGQVGGTVTVGQGGTGATTAAAALSNLGGVPTTRTLTVGSNLVGGGDLSANRTISLSTDPSVTSLTASGHITGPVRDAGGQVLNAKVFGAVGDGATDDTDALADALSAASAQSITLYLPPGVYLTDGLDLPAETTVELSPGAVLKTSDSVTMNGTNTRLIGHVPFLNQSNPPFSSNLVWTGSPGGVILKIGVGGSPAGVEVRGIMVDGGFVDAGDNGVANSVTGVQIGKSDFTGSLNWGKFHQLSVVNCLNGLDLISVQDTQFYDVGLFNPDLGQTLEQWGDWGIRIGAHAPLVTNVYFTNTIVTNFTDAVLCGGPGVTGPVFVTFRDGYWNGPPLNGGSLLNFFSGSFLRVFGINISGPSDRFGAETVADTTTRCIKVGVGGGHTEHLSVHGCYIGGADVLIEGHDWDYFEISDNRILVYSNANSAGFLNTSTGTGGNVRQNGRWGPNRVIGLTSREIVGGTAGIAANFPTDTSATLPNGLVANGSQSNTDSRIAGQTSANLLYVKASADAIGIGGTPAAGTVLDLSANDKRYTGANLVALNISTDLRPSAGSNGALLNVSGAVEGTNGIANAYGVLVSDVNGTSSGSITNTYLFKANAPSGSLTRTNLYGMFLDDLTAAATNYAIYTNAGRVRFGDRVGVNNSNPAGQLHVQTANSSTVGQVIRLSAAQADDALQVLNSSDDKLVAITGGGALELLEMSPPSTPPSDTVRLFVQDNGSGKPQLAVKWDDGTTTVLATHA
jgi:hypothetical protein